MLAKVEPIDSKPGLRLCCYGDAKSPTGETAVFDLSLPKLWVLGVLVVVIFGPSTVRRIARALHSLRR